MTRSFLVVLFVSVACVSVSGAGCSSCNPPPGEGEGEGEGGNPAEARQLCEVWTRGELDFALELTAGVPDRCVAAEVPTFDGAQFASDATTACNDDTNPVFLAFDEALKKGTVTFHQDAIDACSAIDTSDPANANADPATCQPEGLFTPNLKQGDACTQDWECPDGTHCEADPLNEQALSCLAPAQAGDACADALAINPGDPQAARTCDPSLSCVNNVCTAKLASGADCSNGTCQDDLRCDQTQTPPKCAAKIATGGAGCSSSDDCADSDATCSPAGTCVLPVDDGAACVPGADVCAGACSTCRPTTPGGTTNQCQDRGVAGAACASNDDCSHGFVCDTTTTHACVEGGAAGAPCAQTDADCRAGFVCNDDGAACVAQPALGDTCGPTTTSNCKDSLCNGTHCVAGNAGDTCDSDLACAGDNLCRASDNTCQPAPTTGPCSTDGECGDGVTCDDSNNTCVPLPGAGDACVGSQQVCGAGLFCDGSTTTCTPLKDAGSTCGDGTECKSGSCVSGTCTAAGPSCVTSKEFFPLFVVLSLCLPVGRRVRRIVVKRR